MFTFVRKFLINTNTNSNSTSSSSNNNNNNNNNNNHHHHHHNNNGARDRSTLCDPRPTSSFPPPPLSSSSSASSSSPPTGPRRGDPCALRRSLLASRPGVLQSAPGENGSLCLAGPVARYFSDSITSNPATDESAKENLAAGPASRRTPPPRPGGAPLYGPSPTSLRARVADSPDVCCCALCNKARLERGRIQSANRERPEVGIDVNSVNGGKRRNNVDSSTRTSDGLQVDRTLREISLKSNGCNKGYKNDDDDDDYDDGDDDDDVSERRISGRRCPEVLQLMTHRLKGGASEKGSTLSTTSVSSFGTRTRSSTVSLPKFEFSSLSSAATRSSRTKATTPPGKFDSETSTSLCSVATDSSSSPSSHAREPRSPLSLQDGEEGAESYQKRLVYLNSPSHLEATSGVFHPPNVTIRHVEEVRATGEEPSGRFGCSPHSG